MINPGAHIGDNAVIGSGSVVTGDIEFDVEDYNDGVLNMNDL